MKPRRGQPRRTASKEEASNEAASTEEASKEAISKEEASKEATSKEEALKKEDSNEATSKGETSKEAASKEEASKEANSKDAALKEEADEASEEATSKEEHDRNTRHCSVFPLSPDPNKTRTQDIVLCSRPPPPPPQHTRHCPVFRVRPPRKPRTTFCLAPAGRNFVGEVAGGPGGRPQPPGAKCSLFNTVSPYWNPRFGRRVEKRAAPPTLSGSPTGARRHSWHRRQPQNGEPYTCTSLP